MKSKKSGRDLRRNGVLGLDPDLSSWTLYRKCALSGSPVAHINLRYIRHKKDERTHWPQPLMKDIHWIHPYVNHHADKDYPYWRVRYAKLLCESTTIAR